MKRFMQHAAYKSIAGIVLLLVVFSIITSIVGNSIFTEALLDQYADGAFLTADAAAAYVNADRMELYELSGGSSDEYLDASKHLDELCNSTGSMFIYVIRPDLSDYAHITFLFSLVNHKSSFSEYPFGYVRETTNDEYREKYRAFYEKRSDSELVVRDKGYIESDPHITAMIGLKDSKGNVQAILCVQRQMEDLSSFRRYFVDRIMQVLFALVILVIIGQSALINHSLLQPLKLISKETKRFARENVTPPKKLRERIRSRDEIGQLAESIDQMEEQIQTNVENLTRITAERERIATELTLATRIQADMLPSDFPCFPERPEFEIYASMDPARAVGGDFYNFFLIDDDHLCVLIADVAGKGIPAALFMMASSIILAHNAMLGRSPSEILSDTNEAICAHNQEEMFVTVWLGILEISTGKLTAANAGHEYPALYNPDGCFELLIDKHGFVVGAMENARYREYELVLEPGSKLFLYTDGVPEATDAHEKLFGTERMVAALNDEPDASPEQILKNVRRAVDDFVKDAEQFDDLTMLCLEYRGRPEKEGA